MHHLRPTAGGHPLRTMPHRAAAQVLLPLLGRKHQETGNQQRGGLLSEWGEVSVGGLECPLGVHVGKSGQIQKFGNSRAINFQGEITTILAEGRVAEEKQRQEQGK